MVLGVRGPGRERGKFQSELLSGKTYAGSSFDIAYSIQETIDGGYAAC